jgi:GDP-L-fucose synthase
MTEPSREFWEGKNVLITGGTSFVGKNLTKQLDKLGATYKTFHSKEYDLTKPVEADAVFAPNNYDFIVHMAALQAAADWPMHHTGIQLYTNSLIHVNTLEAWKKYQPQAKFIGVGSSCSFPGDIPILSEEDVDKGALHPSVYSYGLTKKLLGVGIKAYRDQYGLKGIMPIFATLYGPHDDFDLKTAHVVSALIAKFCNAKKDGQKEVEVWGDGTQTREIIYVEDQINGLLMAAQHYEGDTEGSNYLLNIGTGIETSVRDLAETIKKASGFEGEIRFNPNKFVGVKRKVLNVEKAKREIGWTTANRMHSLEEGLAKTIDWYYQNK